MSIDNYKCVKLFEIKIEICLLNKGEHFLKILFSEMIRNVPNHTFRRRKTEQKKKPDF